jgi:type II restriction/modification system DNA methylase subunit YeeA
MTPQEFVAKWKKANLSERSAYQQHFLDLCDVVGQDKPAAADPEGAFYTFERGVSKTDGGKGWADVWFRGHFGWEYKGKHKDLAAAYGQLLLYREALENPPLLVVCDLDRFEIHTNFTGTAKRVYAFNLDHLAEPAHLDTLRKLFIAPDALRPGQTTESVTRQAAERFGLLADGMRVRGIPAQPAAHFLMKLMFCMFAEDIGLLGTPEQRLFKRILANSRDNPPRLADHLRLLFQAMATGGYFGADNILHFNGGLFADADVIELRPDEIKELILVNEYDWASVEPSIFGTLFERTLDETKRAQIGAHYTSREDILTLLEPVVMAPLRREWADVKAKCDALWDKLTGQGTGGRGRRATSKETKPRKDHDRLLQDFVERLAHVSILDPACGSGNFLYVAINLLLDLEKEVITYAAAHGTSLLPQVRPTHQHHSQLLGIEINPIVQQLAQVVIWIGYLQWKHDNGFPAPRNPVLDPIESIRLRDAIIDLSDVDHPKEPIWPTADFIIGNPPFLGDKKLRAGLGDDYVRELFALYGERLPNQSDLCCYWFEKARRMVAENRTRRVGLLATQGIRGGASRRALERIKETGDIFFAESDRDWILEGANVHVSMIGFDNGAEVKRSLNGRAVATINSNLSATADITSARPLPSMLGIGFIGVSMHGPFEIAEHEAMSLVRAGGNPNSRGVGTVRYRRLVANDEDCAKQLAKRTLTNLYNQRPAWLDHAHRRLDEAVFAAYGWPADLTDDQLLAKLLELNLAHEPAG